MRFPLPAALTVLALLASGPASAQPPMGPRTFGLEEIATDAAYGFCPLLLAARFQLNAPQLAERGFAPRIEKQVHPRFGALQLVTAKRTDGVIVFGGAPGKVCTVVISGEKRANALVQLRERMSWTGLDFKPSPYPGPEIPDARVERFKAAVEGQTLYVQLVETGGATPAVTAQLFAMNE